jgi:hypothetical protein
VTTTQSVNGSLWVLSRLRRLATHTTVSDDLVDVTTYGPATSLGPWACRTHQVTLGAELKRVAVHSELAPVRLDKGEGGQPGNTAGTAWHYWQRQDGAVLAAIMIISVGGQ